VRFSPVSPISAPSPWFDALLASIDAATRSVDVMIYALTRDEIAEALTRARSRGVAVRVLVHSQYAGEHPATLLRDARVELRVARVHTKAAIIDGRTVFTGSANWSANSWANNELSLTIEDPSIASKYTAAFERTFSAAPPR
jgi:phosphatidylserine/phosphatidylglycerophosphate/cardiolipin synthase-like enzyme